MPVDNLCWLDQPLQRDLVGDKAFYLGLLLQNQHPVVPGFVVSAKLLQQFLLQVNWQNQLLADLPNTFLYVNANQPWQLQAVAQQIRQAILATPLPESLLNDLQQAVVPWQSSTVIFRASFSLQGSSLQGSSLQAGLDPALATKTQGLLESHACHADRESLAQGLKQVWTGLFRAKSLLYWQRFGIQLQQIKLAVLVQPLRPGRAAGTLQIAGDQVQIQAAWGLGQTLELGEADCYGGDLSGSDLSGSDLSGGDLHQGWQSQAVVQKRYAYELATDETPEADSSADWLSEHQAGLRLRYVAAEHQSQPVLTADRLQVLVALAQQAQATLKMPLRLEWILVDGCFQWTQAVPQVKAALHAARSPAPAQPPDPSSARLTGLAAAPGRAVAVAWVVDSATLEADWAKALDGMPEGAILVTATLTPEQIIRLRQVSGFVTEQGGMTSHAAILARELRIPAVVGVEQARQRIQTGEWLAMDGELGELYRSSLPFVELPWPPHWTPHTTPSLHPQPNSSHSPTATQLWVSLSQLDHLAEAAAAPVSGVGLLRSELMLLDLFGGQHPEDWLQRRPRVELVAQLAERIGQFAVAFAPRPVFYRALDIRAQEFGSDSPHESMLGVRGALRMQLNPALFQVELAALKQVQQQHPNLSLLLPFVRTVEEFSFCRQQVEQAGLLQPSFQLWIMAEVPSVLFLLPDYAAAGLQGLAIGVNDLTQLLLGVDRDHPQMAAAFNPAHPAVLRALQHLLQTAQTLKLPCSICGQSFRQQPALLKALLDWQITAVSVDLSEVAWVAEAMQMAEATRQAEAEQKSR